MICSGRGVGGLWIWVYNPGLNDFARMIFYGLKYMGNQDDENSSEYKKTKRFFIKFTNKIYK